MESLNGAMALQRQEERARDAGSRPCCRVLSRRYASSDASSSEGRSPSTRSPKLAEAIAGLASAFT